MTVRVKLFYPHLLQLTGGRDVVEVHGGTVGECLFDLVRQFPGIRNNIFADEGRLLRFVAVYVNEASTYKCPYPLAVPTKDGDELSIVLLIAGG